MSAYRKLLLHNEVVSGKGANCLNDITKVLHISSNSNSLKVTNNSELEQLSNFDFENHIDYDDDRLIEPCVKTAHSLNQHSTAYVASILETAVIKKISNKGKKSCSACMQIFLENEITDDTFTEYKSQISNILQPCKSTIDFMNTVDNLLDKYKSQTISFSAMLTHIIRKINKDRFYGQSTYDQHDHKEEFIELVIKTYMDIVSVEACKTITKMSQKTQHIRHSNLKETHRAGQ